MERKRRFGVEEEGKKQKENLTTSLSQNAKEKDGLSLVLIGSS